MREKLLVFSGWLANSSLKFYSRIAPLCEKGAIVDKILVIFYYTIDVRTDLRPII